MPVFREDLINVQDTVEAEALPEVEIRSSEVPHPALRLTRVRMRELREVRAVQEILS